MHGALRQISTPHGPLEARDNKSIGERKIGFLLVDGLKKYLESASPSTEMELTKNKVCTLYSRI
jgi:hypothetical protein